MPARKKTTRSRKASHPVNKDYGVAVIVVAVVLSGLIFLNRPQPSSIPVLPTPEPTPIEALFSCDDGKTIDASFDNVKSEVTIKLSDGREMTLPQTVSADGGRYANSDESFVFWNKGNTAFIEEGNQTTYQNCETN